MSWQRAIMLTLTAEFLFGHVALFPSLLDPQDELYGDILIADQKIDNLSVLQTKPVTEQIARMIQSDDEKIQEEGKKALEDLKAQLDDEKNEFAHMTVNGLNFLVHLGASGTALRGESTNVIVEFWEAFVEGIKDLFYRIFRFFGFIKDDNRDVVKTVKKLEPLNAEDLRFLLPALRDFVEMLKKISSLRREILDDLKKEGKKHTISEKTKAAEIKSIESDEQYARQLQEYIDQKEIDLANMIKEGKNSPKKEDEKNGTTKSDAHSK